MASKQINLINRLKLYVLALVITLISACTGLPNTQIAVLDDYNIEYATLGKGSPIVVFESGFASDMTAWSKVFKEVSKESKVFAYNRKGTGYSQLKKDGEDQTIMAEVSSIVGELALEKVAPRVSTAISVAKTGYEFFQDESTTKKKQSRTAKVIVEELRQLLKSKDLNPPYILVGHSLGGLYQLYFAKTYPNEVAGLILVDSSHPQQKVICRVKVGPMCDETPWLLDKLMNVLPDELLSEIKSAEITGQEVLSAGKLNDNIPFVVISRAKTNTAPIDKIWSDLQNDLATYSTQSQHISAANSGHFIQNAQPEIVINAINRLVKNYGNQP